MKKKSCSSALARAASLVFLPVRMPSSQFKRMAPVLGPDDTALLDFLGCPFAAQFCGVSACLP